MKAHYRDIAKHSAVYGLAHVFVRGASFLLLPLYTTYLRPADYGCIAVLDLTANLMALLVGSGIASATSRFHFEAEDEAGRDRVWWTGWTIAAALGLAIILPAWVARDALARLTLGPGVARGGFYYALVLPTLLFGSIGEVPNSYVRVRKWSVFFMVLVIARLLLNIALNVYFVAVRQMGVAGILLGNLIVAGLNVAILSAVLMGSRGRFALSWSLARGIVRFGWPMTVSALLVMIMHQADRYLLRLYLPLDRVGVYSLGYTIGEGVGALLQAPFVAIWGVAIYEIAAQPDAKETYVKVFRYFVDLMLLIMLGVSLFARPILGLMAARDFAEAADLVPIIGLAYVLFSTADHFKVPAVLANRTMSLVPVAATAAAVNLVANLMLIPLMGIHGAAWATVLTFAAFSLVGLLRYRRIDRYDYPLLRGGAVLLGIVATYVGWRALGSIGVPAPWQLVIAAVLWAAWAIALFGHAVRPLLPSIVGALAAWPFLSRARLLGEAMTAREGT